MNFKNKLIRFVIAGMINTILWYILYALLIFIQLNFALATFVATLVGILFNFFIFKKFVFKSNGSLFLFYLVYIVIYLEETFVIWILSVFHINYYIGGLFALMIGALLSFVLNNMYVFKHSIKG